MDQLLDVHAGSLFCLSVMAALNDHENIQASHIMSTVKGTTGEYTYGWLIWTGAIALALRSLSKILH